MKHIESLIQAPLFKPRPNIYLSYQSEFGFTCEVVAEDRVEAAIVFGIPGNDSGFWCSGVYLTISNDYHNI